MSELFAMSSRGPATATLSLSILAGHGGKTAQHVILIASVPLTAEAWAPLREGEVLAISHGQATDSSAMTSRRVFL